MVSVNQVYAQVDKVLGDSALATANTASKAENPGFCSQSMALVSVIQGAIVGRIQERSEQSATNLEPGNPQVAGRDLLDPAFVGWVSGASADYVYATSFELCVTHHWIFSVDRHGGLRRVESRWCLSDPGSRLTHPKDYYSSPDAVRAAALYQNPAICR